MTLYEFNKEINAREKANLPEWKRNQPTAWGCQSNKPTGRGGVGSEPTLHNPVIRGNVGYSGR